MKNRILFLLYLTTCSFISSSQEYVDDSHIHSCLIYNYLGNYSARSIESPIANISHQNLILEFDDLRPGYTQYRVKIIHCDYNWELSSLQELEYLDSFNEFFINNYKIAEGTKINYIHYTFRIPKLKKSGNYRIQVFENKLNGNLAADRRFMIFESNASVSMQVFPANSPEKYRTHQQVELELALPNIAFPERDLKILVRQNGRWNKTKFFDLKTLSPKGRNRYTFRFFNDENLFLGGNEFRFFDLSSNFHKGVNIQKITQSEPDEFVSYPQKNRNKKGYLSATDNNGSFANFSQDGSWPDYLNLKVILKEEYLGENSKVSILGAFNGFSSEKGEMKFNPNLEQYEKTLFLKQGVYDLIFAKLNEVDPEGYFENNFSDTQNRYETFVYQIPPGNTGHKLIGYAQVLTQQ